MALRWPGSTKSAPNAAAGLPKSRKSAILIVEAAGIRRMSVNTMINQECRGRTEDLFDYGAALAFSSVHILG